MSVAFFANAAYIVAALLFILSLAGLSHHESSKTGLRFGMTGMAIALVATIWLTIGNLWGQAQATLGIVILVVAVVIGAAIGLWRAKVVEMTGMPELIALLHSFVGLAAVLIGWNGALATEEISPELVPADAAGAIQSTEAAVGPYALNDFFLFYTLRQALTPAKIAFLAWHAWRKDGTGRWPFGFPEERKEDYTLAEIRRWLENFVRRFFATSQFKRSAIPNGPKVSSGGSLSPRGDWRAPSDGLAEVWLAEVAQVPRK